jgi:hypothetical protein
MAPTLRLSFFAPDCVLRHSYALQRTRGRQVLCRRIERAGEIKRLRIATTLATEALAGTYMPDQGSGERFRTFVSTFFPKVYEPHVEKLWKFRNRMIHSFNPVPFTILCHNSRMHLCEVEGMRMLNAEDFYADVVTASRAYFTALYSDIELQKRFGKRVTSDDGGRSVSQRVAESSGVTVTPSNNCM